MAFIHCQVTSTHSYKEDHSEMGLTAVTYNIEHHDIKKNNIVSQIITKFHRSKEFIDTQAISYTKEDSVQ
jgi:hypothetical protein